MRPLVLIGCVAAFSLSACNCGGDPTSDAGSGGGMATAGGSTTGGGSTAGGGSAAGGGTTTGGGSIAGGGSAGGGSTTGGGSSGGGSTDSGTPDSGTVDAGNPDAGACFASGSPILYGPSHYYGPVNSPFQCTGEFFLYDFENHSNVIPGVEHAGVVSSSFGPSLIDSIDIDDGVLDGTCVKDGGASCDALFGGGTLVFTFDAGFLPTYVGLVWTDGDGEISFLAYRADGGIIGQIGPWSDQDAGSPDNSIFGTCDEDRFFGIASPEPIYSVKMSNTQGGIEIDHFQFGR